MNYACFIQICEDLTTGKWGRVERENHRDGKGKEPFTTKSGWAFHPLKVKNFITPNVCYEDCWLRNINIETFWNKSFVLSYQEATCKAWTWIILSVTYSFPKCFFGEPVNNTIHFCLQWKHPSSSPDCVISYSPVHSMISFILLSSSLKTVTSELNKITYVTTIQAVRCWCPLSSPCLWSWLCPVVFPSAFLLTPDNEIC